MTNRDRYLGALWGSLVGDALGVPVEFENRRERLQDPVTGMRGFGTHFQPPGTWSDDGSLLLCSVESLTVCRGFDAEDLARRFLAWRRHGKWSATGGVFDIGIATSKALDRHALGVAAVKCGGRGEYDNGNGSLMRILPLSLAAMKSGDESWLDDGSAVTHGHLRARLACRFHAGFVRHFLKGGDVKEAFRATQEEFATVLAVTGEAPAFQRLVDPGFSALPEDSIHSSGYVIDTLEASFWCLLRSETFPSCVLAAVNLGEDTDTTGCVAGGLAGLVYGRASIPGEWLGAIPQKGTLDLLFDQFLPFCP